MKRLPESELEIMMIIWEYNRPVNRWGFDSLRLHKRVIREDPTAKSGWKSMESFIIMYFLYPWEEGYAILPHTAGKSRAIVGTGRAVVDINSEI